MIEKIKKIINKKKAFTIFTVLVGFISITAVSALDVDVWGTSGWYGPGGSGGNPDGTSEDLSSWGVRATVVDKNHERLTIESCGKTYTSKTMDFLNPEMQNSCLFGGSACQFDVGKVWTCNGSYSGGDTLYYRGDAACTRVSGNDTYQDREGDKWAWQDAIDMKFQNFNSGKSSVGTSATTALKNDLHALEDEQNFPTVNKIYKQLMGIDIEEIGKCGDEQCSDALKKLDEAYIAFEPLMGISLGTDYYFGSGSEISLMFGQWWGYAHVLPRLAYTMYVDNGENEDFDHEYYRQVYDPSASVDAGGLNDGDRNTYLQRANDTTNSYFMYLARVRVPDDIKDNTCEPTCTVKEEDGKKVWYNSKGEEVSQEEFEKDCPCSHDGNSYRDSEGKSVTKEEWESECTCVEVDESSGTTTSGNKPQLGPAIDEGGSSAGSGKFRNKQGEIVSKDEYAKDCLVCEEFEGDLYGANGDKVDKEKYHEECGEPCEVEDGVYYGKDGKKVTEEQYKKECEGDTGSEGGACPPCSSTSEGGVVNLVDNDKYQDIMDDKAPATIDGTTKYPGYFEKPFSAGGGKTWCREEYKIRFPNGNDQMMVTPGRYFVVNKRGGALYATGIPNFKSIKVEKIRECWVSIKPTEEEHWEPENCWHRDKTIDQQKSDQKSKLDQFRNVTGASGSEPKNDPVAAGDTGKISLSYTETVGNGQYNIENRELQINPYRTVDLDPSDDEEKYRREETYKYEYVVPDHSECNPETGECWCVTDTKTYYTYYIDTYKTTKYYELSDINDDNFYRWVNRSTNAVSEKKPGQTNDYLDLGTSTIPVSYGNYGDGNGVAAHITLNYELPTGDSYSYAHKVWTSDEGSEGACYEALKDSEEYNCDVKLYPCFEGDMLCKNTYDNPVCDPDDPECNLPECVYMEGTYYGPDGEILDEGSEILDEGSFNAKCGGCHIDESGQHYCHGGACSKDEYLKECPYSCTQDGDKYYGTGGYEVTKEQYESECPGDGGECENKCDPDPRECKNGNCDGVDICSQCEGGKCCPDTENVCPVNGQCPTPARQALIYRAVDLTNPFPGQTDYKRATGNNWCAWDINKGGISCKNDNGVVQGEITNARGSQGAAIYSKTPLFTFDLDNASISAIRNYNKQQRRSDNDYNDYTLQCRDNKVGSCESTFIRNSQYGYNASESACSSFGSAECYGIGG